MKRMTLPVVAVATAAVLAGCAGATKQSSPDPTSDQIQMAPPLQVLGLPEGFRNLALVCDKFGNLWGVTSRGSDIAGGPNGGGLGSGVAVLAGGCKQQPK